MGTLTKTGLLALALTVISTGAEAQDNVEAAISADVVNQYV